MHFTTDMRPAILRAICVQMQLQQLSKQRQTMVQLLASQKTDRNRWPVVYCDNIDTAISINRQSSRKKDALQQPEKLDTKTEISTTNPGLRLQRLVLLEEKAVETIKLGNFEHHLSRKAEPGYLKGDEETYLKSEWFMVCPGFRYCHSRSWAGCPGRKWKGLNIDYKETEALRWRGGKKQTWRLSASNEAYIDDE